MKAIAPVVLVVLASLLLSASAASSITLSTWSSYVDLWATYAPNPSDPDAAEISAFTPECPILVTRIEIDAHIGPYQFSTPTDACVNNPSLTLTGGSQPFTLTLNTPPNVTGGGLHSYTDSGALKIRGAAQAKLTLSANQGDIHCLGGNEVNIVVHYSTLYK